MSPTGPQESGNSSPLVITADRVFDPQGEDQAGWVVVRDGQISARGVSSDLPGDLRAMPAHHVAWLAPGLVDIHVHGAMGVDFGDLGADPTPAIEHHHATGATTLLASLASAPLHTTIARMRELQPYVDSHAIAGIHLEGPWLAPSRRGAHAPELLRAPDAADLTRLLEAGADALRMVTLAPELPGALLATARLVEAGVVVAVGHTDADADTVSRAVDAGARVMTHLFNTMPPLHHRAPGPVGVGLSEQRLTVEVIADGEHLDDRVIDLVLATAGHRTAIVSDAMAATGLGAGNYQLAGSSIIVRDGVARLAQDSSLAGSTTPLGAAFSRLHARGVGMQSLIRSASIIPARALGLTAPQLRIGDCADLIALDGGQMHVMRRGQWLGSRPPHRLAG